MDFIQRFIPSRKADLSDAELAMAAANRVDLLDPNRRATVVPVSDNLFMFRFLLGIITNPSMDTRAAKGRPASNVGIYTRVVQNEIAAAKKYKVFSILINSCLGIQLIVAAALTALGAADTTHNSAITVFGAVNTVIAGFLTFLKGSGLPHRLKYYENEWSKLREFIEQRERDFSHEACTLDLYKVIYQIESMYEDVRSDIEANTPESYMSRTKNSPQIHVADPRAIAPSAVNANLTSEKLKELRSKAEQEGSKFAWEVETKAKDATKDVGMYDQKTMSAANQEVQDYAEDRMRRAVPTTRDELATSQITTTTETLQSEPKSPDS